MNMGCMVFGTVLKAMFFLMHWCSDGSGNCQGSVQGGKGQLYGLPGLSHIALAGCETRGGEPNQARLAQRDGLVQAAQLDVLAA